MTWILILADTRPHTFTEFAIETRRTPRLQGEPNALIARTSNNKFNEYTLTLIPRFRKCRPSRLSIIYGGLHSAILCTDWREGTKSHGFSKQQNKRHGKVSRVKAHFFESQYLLVFVRWIHVGNLPSPNAYVVLILSPSSVEQHFL